MATDSSRHRGIIAALSASVIFAIAASEGYTSKAVIPVPGDVPTYGHGTTRHSDGSPVRMGETTTPERAMQDLKRDVGKFAAAVRRCAPVPMFQHEFDAYARFIYNIGESAFCGSTLVKRLRAGEYEAACRELLKWDKVKGRVVRGLTKRRQSEYKQCTENNPA